MQLGLLVGDRRKKNAATSVAKPRAVEEEKSTAQEGTTSECFAGIMRTKCLRTTKVFVPRRAKLMTPRCPTQY
ncbi:hypothetical protein PHMEG_0005641 [Phytophthora megakarya]|uniref:Uncharacterized protein n=1 Tax=Phytophthora megakarya TaxID=4795 RepID=A0A225WSB9_9STRA|nr:hypothetical protein PHMEG_0005641 [Phytophthora megakarya]